MKKGQSDLSQVVKYLFVFLLLFSTYHHVHADMIFYEDFELGWNNWGADNGVWEVGVPTSGPQKTYSGTQCAATNLDGNYDPATESQLISPSVLLSPIIGYEEIHLRFWQWFSFNLWDGGIVRVSSYNEGEDTWSDWADVSSPIEGTSNEWSMMDVDLTSYSGRKIRVAFFLFNSWQTDDDFGWYIDDVEVAVFDPTATTSPSTTSSVGSSTTTINGWNCPSELICGEDSKEIQLLRHIRDNVLTRSPLGQDIIKLYYQWNPIIVEMMEEDEAFKEEVKEMIDGILSIIGTME